MTTESEGRAARVAAVDATIRTRRTAKLLGDPAAIGEAGDDGLDDERRGELDAMIALAGTAPFHKRAHERHRDGAQPSIVPWRFHVLERPSCRRLLDEILRRAADAAEGDEARWTRAAGSKIPNLLAAAGTLVQVTWLPDPPKEGSAETFADNDVEHVAAAGAAVQNLLLAAEARGWYAYWSSGGILRDPEIFERLGIPPGQRLLGAVFLSPPDTAFERDIAGGLRDQRGEVGDWSRRVTLD